VGETFIIPGWQPPHMYADGALCTYFPSTDPLPDDETTLLQLGC